MSRSTKPVGTPVMSEGCRAPAEFHALDHLAQQGLDGDEAVVGAVAGFGDLEDALLGLVEQRLDVAPGGIQRIAGDLVADRDQLAQDGALADDLGVARMFAAEGVLLAISPR
jgi:hypothetical protein